MSVAGIGAGSPYLFAYDQLTRAGHRNSQSSGATGAQAFAPPPPGSVSTQPAGGSEGVGDPDAASDVSAGGNGGGSAGLNQLAADFQNFLADYQASINSGTVAAAGSTGVGSTLAPTNTLSTALSSDLQALSNDFNTLLGSANGVIGNAGSIASSGAVASTGTIASSLLGGLDGHHHRHHGVANATDLAQNETIGASGTVDADGGADASSSSATGG